MEQAERAKTPAGLHSTLPAPELAEPVSDNRVVEAVVTVALAEPVNMSTPDQPTVAAAVAADTAHVAETAAVAAVDTAESAEVIAAAVADMACPEMAETAVRMAVSLLVAELGGLLVLQEAADPAW